MVSACLLGENCKYNGGNNYSEKLERFLEGHEVIRVCPEQLGGLPTPRVPAEIRDGIVTNHEGISVDAEFRKGAEKALQIALSQGAELAVLQSRSPSCGPKAVYDGTFSKRLVEGKGIFAARLAEKGIPTVDIEDLEEAEDLASGKKLNGNKRR